MRARVLVLLLPLLAAAAAAGCTADKKINLAPFSDASHVSGTLSNKDDDRPVDGGVALTVNLGPGRDEIVMVPSIFTGQPPSTVTLALQQKVDAIQVGDRLTATGKRNAEGMLIVEVIEIHEP
ncbi:MAG: hypothetical protein ABIP29_04275 [Candidatus Eisenbacteria bacterium]